MAKRKYEFRPDKTQGDFFNKLYMTPAQRMTLLRWSLHALVLLMLSVIQDVILCQMSIYGATTDLVPCAILLTTVILGANRGSLYVLIAAAMYKFSGTAPGYYVIALIPIWGLLAAMLRQGYFRKSIGSQLLCACLAVLMYEASIFGFGLLFGNTAPERWLTFLLTAVYSLVSYAVLYPVTTAIEKIGGNTWND